MSCHIQNTICINIEGDFNLRHTSWGWWDSFKIEFTKLMVILSHLSLSFKYLNHDTWLVISIGSEDLRFLGWDCGISVDQWSHNTTSGLNTHG